MTPKVALITGAAKRIGSAIARTLHQQGIDIILHYHHSQEEADSLAEELNRTRKDSAILVTGDITKSHDCEEIIQASVNWRNQLDILINNASSFYATPLGEINDLAWDDLMGSNLKGPLFLSQAARFYLAQTQGKIVNIVDIHADRPLKNYTVYCCAKAGLVMLTKSLARELAPTICVNAVAPGAILWPEDGQLPEIAKQHILDRTLLKRIGEPQDIAAAVNFLVSQNYITGQIIAVDGGRSIKD